MNFLSHETEAACRFLLLLLLLSSHVHLSKHIVVWLLHLLLTSKSTWHVHSHIGLLLLLLIKHIHAVWLLESWVSAHSATTLALALHHASVHLAHHIHITSHHVVVVHLTSHRLTHLAHLAHWLAHTWLLLLPEHLVGLLGLEASHLTSTDVHTLLVVLLWAPKAIKSIICASME